MSTDVVADARRALVDAAVAGAVTAALEARHEPPASLLTDENAGRVWKMIPARVDLDIERANAGLRDLHGRLERLLSRVTGCVGGADLGALLARYRLIREAQHGLTVGALQQRVELELPGTSMRVPYTRLLQIAGAIANIDQVWPDWRQKLRAGHSRTNPPWDYPAGQPFEIAFTAKNLVWLASGPAKPWVPTIPQAAASVRDQIAAEELRLVGLTIPHRDLVSLQIN
jgi:hypothetical protein